MSLNSSTMAFPSSSRANFVGCPFSNNLKKDAAFLANFDTEQQFTLQKPDKDDIAGVLVECLSVPTVSLVFVATRKRPDMITWQR